MPVTAVMPSLRSWKILEVIYAPLFRAWYRTKPLELPEISLLCPNAITRRQSHFLYFRKAIWQTTTTAITASTTKYPSLLCSSGMLSKFMP